MALAAGSGSEGHFVSVAVAFVALLDVDGLVLVLAPIGLIGSEGRYSDLTIPVSGFYLEPYGRSPQSADIPPHNKKR